jgi:hypothetical protein
MKPAREILAALAKRDLLRDCERIAKGYAISLECEICDGANRKTEVVEARHAVWLFLIDHFGGKQSPVVRIWGCDRTSLLHAETRLAIVRVLLAAFEDPAGHVKVQLEYARRAGGSYGVNDLVRAHTTWFGTYELAHRVFVQMCEEAGELTFRTNSLGTGGAS